MNAYRRHQSQFSKAHNIYMGLPEDTQCDIDERFFNCDIYGGDKSSRLDWENFLINELIKE